MRGDEFAYHDDYRVDCETGPSLPHIRFPAVSATHEPGFPGLPHIRFPALSATHEPSFP